VEVGEGDDVDVAVKVHITVPVIVHDGVDV
jgi:hypothetical protein